VTANNHDAVLADIASIHDWIGLELERDEPRKLADLVEIKHQLKTVLTTLSGASDAEIERNLEELRM